MSNGYYAEPGGYTMEQMEALTRAAGVKVVRPHVDIIPRGVIQAGMETEDVSFDGVIDEREQIVIPSPRLPERVPTVSPDWSYTPPANGIVSGVETMDLAPANGVAAVPTIAPVAVALTVGALSLGFLRAMFARYGMIALKWFAKWGSVGVLLGLITGGLPDTHEISELKKRRRYSIGHNPRVRTLAKVSRHCKRLLKRHEKIIREFLPKPTKTYGIPPSRALSAIERAAIKG